MNKIMSRGIDTMKQIEKVSMKNENTNPECMVYLKGKCYSDYRKNKICKHYVQLVRWLYNNHRKILRKFEALNGNLRIEFAEEKQ